MTHEKELLARVEKLEAVNRATKGVACIFAVLCVMLLAMGQAPTKKTIEANEFVLKDDTGSVAGKLL
jgi:hypothetical protein